MCANIGFLLLVQRLGFRIGEMGQRDGRQVEMRLDKFGRLRHRDMRVNIYGRAFRPHVAPRLAVLARSRRAVLVPLFGHAWVVSLKDRETTASGEKSNLGLPAQT